MGNCLSDPSSSSKPKSSPGGGQRLGSGPSPSSGAAFAPAAGARASGPAAAAAANGRFSGGGQAVGDGFEDPTRIEGDGGAKAAAARAAEQRAQAAAARGVSSSNPKAGQLSAKLNQHNRDVDARRGAAGGEPVLAKAADWN